MEKPASIVGIQRILVPTDFSPTSQRALDYATRLAESTGAVMILMHALELPDTWSVGETPTDFDPELMERLRATPAVVRQGDRGTRGPWGTAGTGDLLGGSRASLRPDRDGNARSQRLVASVAGQCCRGGDPQRAVSGADRARPARERTAAA